MCRGGKYIVMLFYPKKSRNINKYELFLQKYSSNLAAYISTNSYPIFMKQNSLESPVSPLSDEFIYDDVHGHTIRQITSNVTTCVVI